MPEECAVKVFKTTLNEFKTRDRYIKDDHRFRDRFSKQNPRKVIRLWAEKEMCNLSRLVSFMLLFFYFSNSANDFQHSHTVSSAAERKERGRQCLLIMCAIEFVCFTEKSRRSNACEQAQQCSHGVETAGAK